MFYSRAEWPVSGLRDIGAGTMAASTVTVALVVTQPPGVCREDRRARNGGVVTIVHAGCRFSGSMHRCIVDSDFKPIRPAR